MFDGHGVIAINITACPSELEKLRQHFNAHYMHTADADETKLFCRVGGVNTIRK